MIPTKTGLILAALRISPLNRLRIVCALLLFQRKAGIPQGLRFSFGPSPYGPRCPEVYSALVSLEREGLIIRPLHPAPAQVPYYLTKRGKAEADRAARGIPPALMRHLENAVREAGRLELLDLVRHTLEGRMVKADGAKRQDLP